MVNIVATPLLLYFQLPPLYLRHSVLSPKCQLSRTLHTTVILISNDQPRLLSSQIIIQEYPQKAKSRGLEEKKL